LKRFVASKAKQKEIANNRYMRAHVMIHHHVAKVVEATTKYRTNMSIILVHPP
jgi:hypothetical protein